MLRKLLLLSAFLGLVDMANACTNFIVGKKASADGSVICTYNADDYGLFINLCHYPAGTHADQRGHAVLRSQAGSVVSGAGAGWPLDAVQSHRLHLADDPVDSGGDQRAARVLGPCSHTPPVQVTAWQMGMCAPATHDHGVAALP